MKTVSICLILCMFKKAELCPFFLVQRIVLEMKIVYDFSF